MFGVLPEQKTPREIEPQPSTQRRRLPRAQKILDQLELCPAAGPIDVVADGKAGPVRVRELAQRYGLPAGLARSEFTVVFAHPPRIEHHRGSDGYSRDLCRPPEADGASGAGG